jgi:AcrR family transcriptional regulator
MDLSFEKLPEEKKELIRRISIQEFGEKGYKDASTDRITERAGISKGILFYYFKNKKNLYHYIVNYVVDFFIRELSMEKAMIENKDFFERLKEILVTKMKICLQHQEEFQMLLKTFSEPSLEVKKDAAELFSKMAQVYKTLNSDYIYEYFDKSKLREDVDIKYAAEIMSLLFDQLGQKYLVIMIKNR